MSDVSGWQTFVQALGYFLKMFFGSAALGTLTGLISALISFYYDEHVWLGRLFLIICMVSHLLLFLTGTNFSLRLCLMEDFYA